MREEAEASLGNELPRRQKSGVSSAAAASAWKQIQERMKPPKCKGHNEDCVIRQVKKKGPNFGELMKHAYSLQIEVLKTSLLFV